MSFAIRFWRSHTHITGLKQYSTERKLQSPHHLGHSNSCGMHGIGKDHHTEWHPEYVNISPIGLVFLAGAVMASTVTCVKRSVWLLESSEHWSQSDSGRKALNESDRTFSQCTHLQNLSLPHLSSHVACFICFISTLRFSIDPLLTSTPPSGPHPSFLGKSTHLLLRVGISSSDTPPNVLGALGSEGGSLPSLTSDSKVCKCFLLQSIQVLLL